jgi:hypothetical protein
MKLKKFELNTTPEIIYTQDKADGIGKLYINGKRITGLVEIEIKAETKRNTVTMPLRLKVKRIKKDKDDNAIIPDGFEEFTMEEVHELER